ncbi:MAG: riboflavin synthase [Actinomycetota bacterium]|jgi:riboflavin synthase|nr:riboflavin synthase [Actinomycetota bacterium]MCL6093161.1 riboflavin synthase [Actinomycetota bacterium]MDA8167864.1 riboflavin synthase [Actinomycetota bacterium]
MFTGIVEELGKLVSLEMGADSGVITIEADKVLEGTRLGDSIAVNGVCLTARAFGNGTFAADVMPETLRKSNLGNLKRGNLVNLERAMTLGGRLGGHLMLGHVDATGKVVSVRPEGTAVVYTMLAPEQVRRYILPQGSIGVDGISLTVARLEGDKFSVSLIPHTVRLTTLGNNGVGYEVNLEADVIGKYVARMLEGNLPGGHGEGGLTIEKLAEGGFL